MCQDNSSFLVYYANELASRNLPRGEGKVKPNRASSDSVLTSWDWEEWRAPRWVDLVDEFIGNWRAVNKK